MFEAVVSSDWHLNGLAKHFPDHYERQLSEIDKIYQYCIVNNVKYLIVPGDISDTPHMPDNIKMALFALFLKYDGMVTTHYVCGNHDYDDVRTTAMDLIKMISTHSLKTLHVHLKPDTTTIGNVPINFLPYPCLEAPKSKTPHLNFSHVSYNGAIGDNGRKLRVSDEFIQNKGDFNISGHIHKFQYLETRNALYCGAPYQKNFGEEYDCGFVHIKARVLKKEVEVKFKRISTKPEFQFINLHINNQKDLKKLSTSDSIRYKLWVSPDVILPKDLKLQYPNITGGIIDSSTRKAEPGSVVQESSVKAVVSARSRLKTFLRNSGADDGFVKMALKETRKAADVLGIDLQ